MKKNKSFYVFLVLNLVITINVINATDVNQSSDQQSRDGLNLNLSSLVEIKNLTEESGSEKVNERNLNLTNNQETNDHQEPNTFKFSGDDENKHLENLFKIKLNKEEKHIEGNAKFDVNKKTLYEKNKRDLEVEKSASEHKEKCLCRCKRKNCMQMYPVYCMQQIKCQDEMDSPFRLNLGDNYNLLAENPKVEEHPFYPPNPLTDFPNFNQPIGSFNYPHNNYDDPHEIDVYLNPGNSYQVENHDCNDDTIFCASISNLSEDGAENPTHKKIQPSEEAIKQEHEKSLGKALEVTKNFKQQSSEEILKSEQSTELQQNIFKQSKETNSSLSERKKTHSFQELSMKEEKILKETTTNVLRNFDSTLKSQYGIAKLQNIFNNSAVEEMITNAIKSQFLQNLKESSITEEMIKLSLIDVIKNYIENENKEAHKSILIPIAEVNIKIGQWVEETQNNGKSEINKKDGEINNKMNIETQIIPSNQNFGTESGMALKVSSSSKPGKAKIFLEVENPNIISSESDVIENLPVRYYNPNNILTNYNMRHPHQYLPANHQIVTEDSNQNIKENGSPSESKNENFPINKSFFVNSEQRIKENEQLSEASKSRVNSKSESDIHSVSSGNKNGNSQVSGSFKHEQVSETDRSKNLTNNREISEQTQIRGSSRNKKHSMPFINFNTRPERNFNKVPERNFYEYPDRNIYKNARIVGLLTNDQKSSATDRHFYPSSFQKINKNPQFYRPTRRDVDYKMKENVVSNPYINVNKQFIGSASRMGNLENDANLQKRIGMQKNNLYEINAPHLGSLKVPNVEKLSTNERDKYLKINNNVNYHPDSNILGRLIPQNKENSEFVYLGNAMKLPIKFKKLKDGSFSVNFLNKVQNLEQKDCLCHDSRNSPGINKRTIEGKLLNKNDSSEPNSMLNKDSKENLKNHRIRTRRENKEEDEQYKKYLETLLEVNDIPKDDRLDVITDVLEKKYNNKTSFTKIKKKVKSEKDGLKNNLIIEKFKFKTNKQDINEIKSEENKTSGINVGINILNNFLNWIKDLILLPFHLKK